LPKTALAEEQPPQLQISEIMYDFPGSDDGNEWVEIYNFGNEEVKIIAGSGANSWRFSDGSNHTLNLYSGSTIIQPAQFAILADDPATFLTDYPQFSGTIFKVPMSLKNTGDTLKLSADRGLTWFSEVTYSNQCGGDDDGYSLERSQDNWYISQKEGGTPAEENSPIKPLPQNLDQFSEFLNLSCGAIYFRSKVNFVVDGDTLKVENLAGLPTAIRLLGIDSPELGFPFYQQAKDFVFQMVFDKEVEILISPKKAQQIDEFGRTLAVIILNEQILNLSLLREGLAKRFDKANQLILAQNWDEIEQEAKNVYKGIWASYQKGNVVISELLPDPVGNDNELEWIELQNLTSDTLDLSGWILDKKTQFKIPNGTIIAPLGFLVFTRPQTRIALNNDGDSLDLYFSDGTLVDSISYLKAPEGQSFTRFPNGWVWTTTLTPASENIFQEKIITAVKQTNLPAVENKIAENQTTPPVEQQNSIVTEPTKIIKTIKITKTKKYTILVAGSYFSKLQPQVKGTLMLEKSSINWYIQTKITETLLIILLIFYFSRQLWNLFVKVPMQLRH